MKKWASVFICFLISLFSLVTTAEEQQSPPVATVAESTPTQAVEVVAPKVAAPKSQKSTDLSFEDLLVQGKYHFSDEAVTTVEQDKVLDALLGVRMDFKDRMLKSSARQ